MFATDDDKLNPVKAWAITVQSILHTVPNVSEDTTVCSFWTGTKVIQLDAIMARVKLRVIVKLMGEEELGFTSDQVGLHSIRSGGAMAMFLSGVCDIIIQRVGRWESLAFLEYIRSQVENFTLGVSQKMLENEKFHHLNANASKEEQLLYTPDRDGDGKNYISHSVHFSKGVLDSVPEEVEIQSVRR
jgi:hypothetical protein